MTRTISAQSSMDSVVDVWTGCPRLDVDSRSLVDVESLV